MSVRAIVPNYQGIVRDAVQNFGGNIIVYFHWRNHLLFAFPIAQLLEPSKIFGDVVALLKDAYAVHPDTAKIDWSAVVWELNGRPFQPDFSKSLVDNGIDHKSSIVFVTPGLEGLNGTRC